MELNKYYAHNGHLIRKWSKIMDEMRINLWNDNRSIISEYLEKEFISPENCLKCEEIQELINKTERVLKEEEEANKFLRGERNGTE